MWHGGITFTILLKGKRSLARPEQKNRKKWYHPRGGKFFFNAVRRGGSGAGHGPEAGEGGAITSFLSSVMGGGQVDPWRPPGVRGLGKEDW